MPKRVAVTSLDLADLAPYRSLRRNESQSASGLFVAEGDKVVRRLLETDLEIISMLVTDAREAEFAAALEACSPDATLFVTPREVMDAIVGFHLYQGVLALARAPRQPDVAALSSSLPHPQLWIALDALNNAENVGAIIRNAVALGASALISGGNSSSVWMRRTVRNSMGSIFKLPVIEAPSLADSLRTLRSCGVRCLAAHPHANQTPLGQTDLARDVCIVLGNEHHGVAPDVLEACDAHVAIPMSNAVESLNVACTSAAFLYEAARQRGRG